MEAIFDFWILGYRFLQSLTNEFDAMLEEAKRDKKKLPPYIQDYFNVKFFADVKASALDKSITRILNSLTEAVNERNRLPKFLLVIIDKDMLSILDLFAFDANKAILETTSWLVKQIYTIVRRRRISITDKKLGAVFADDPKIIFVRMMRRYEHQPYHTILGRVFAARAKFNDALNDAVRGAEQFMLTVNNCNSPNHFNTRGDLSMQGSRAFWFEIDDLMDKFDNRKIKLLPAPVNTNKFNDKHHSLVKGRPRDYFGRQ